MTKFGDWIRGCDLNPIKKAIPGVHDLASRLAQCEEALAERPPTVHDPGCSAGISTLPCKCSHKDTEAALAACEEFMEKYSND